MLTSRIRQISFQEKEILLIDFSGIKPGPEFFDLMEKIQAYIHAGEPGSTLTLIDVTGSEFDLDMLDALIALASGDKPFIRASAVVGAEGLYEKARDAIERLSQRDFKKFDTREEAMEWLVTH